VPPTETSAGRFSSAIQADEGDVILTDPEPYLYRVLGDNIEHVVTDGDTPERLAFAEYGRADYAYVIRNFQRSATGEPQPVVDTTIGLEPGSVVVMPSRRTLFEEILNENRRKAFQA